MSVNSFLVKDPDPKFRTPQPEPNPALNSRYTNKARHWLLLFTHSVVSDSLVTPWTVARQVPLSIGFPRQEYWSRLSLPIQGVFLTQRWNPCLLHQQAGFLPLSHQGSAYIYIIYIHNYVQPNYFAVYLKLMQHCKSTIIQKKFFKQNKTRHPKQHERQAEDQEKILQLI